MYPLRSPVVALLLSIGLLTACSVEILHDLDEAQANQVLDALHRQGIRGAKVRSAQGNKATYAVSIPRSTAPDAWRVLRQQNLPRQRHKGLGEVFGNVGLVPTAMQERALLRQALAGELARTLESLEGVREARVHVVLPTHDRLATDDAPPPKPRASVLVRLVGDGSPVTEEEVRKLVAGGVDGLAPESVSVVIAKGAGSRSAAGAAVATASVGPFDVASASRGPLLATLIAAVVLLLGLGLGLLLALRWGRRLVHGAAGRPVQEGSMNATAAGAVPGPDYLSRVSMLGRSMPPQTTGTHLSGSRHTGHNLDR